MTDSTENIELITRLFNEFLAWNNKQYTAPSPHFIKQAIILRNGIDNSTWVETGTYLGDTTLLLSQNATFVYSLEPEPSLFNKAIERFQVTENVKIINGASEDIFPVLLPQISGDINFWLDGHYSAGETFKGDKDTPIAEELNSISCNLSRFDRVSVLVDDIRLFNTKNTEHLDYPSLDFLVDWARVNNFNWHIEHDIFIAKNY